MDTSHDLAPFFIVEECLAYFMPSWENAAFVQARILHISQAFLERMLSGVLQRLCEPSEITCKILYLHVGILVRVFQFSSVHSLSRVRLFATP